MQSKQRTELNDLEKAILDEFWRFKEAVGDLVEADPAVAQYAERNSKNPSALSGERNNLSIELEELIGKESFGRLHIGLNHRYSEKQKSNLFEEFVPEIHYDSTTNQPKILWRQKAMTSEQLAAYCFKRFKAFDVLTADGEKNQTEHQSNSDD